MQCQWNISMVNSCVVGGCSNTTSSSSTRRDFLIFHKVPVDSAIRSKWDGRVNRVLNHVRNLKRYSVCSDHFSDDDYEPSYFLKYKVKGFQKFMKLPLRDDAVPNTDRSTGQQQLFIYKFVNEEAQKTPRMRLNRRVLAEMDQFSSTIDTKSYPYAPSNEQCSSTALDSDSLLEVNATPTSPPICDLHEESSESDSEISDDDDDLDYNPDEDVSSDKEDKDDRPRQSHPKKDKRKSLFDFLWTFIAVEQLLEFFKWCPDCGSPAEVVKCYSVGFATCIQYRCSGPSQHSGLWNSSGRLYKRRYNINILFSSAMSMCGISYTMLKSIFGLLKVPIICERRFHIITKKWLNPVVYSMFTKMRDTTIGSLASGGLQLRTLVGDGQFDSPGHCAKYCVYTMLDSASGKILDFMITQRGEFNEELERAGCRELLKKLISKGVDKFNFVTDRHSGIRKMIAENSMFGKIVHYFDIWHMAKSIGKDLTKLCKLKRNAPLLTWVKPIINHFWYSCRNSGGDKTKLIETFHSFLLHITNAHKWTSGAFKKLKGDNLYPQFTKVFQCAHAHLKMKKGHIRRGAWLTRSNKAFHEVFKRLTRKKLSDDILHCAHFVHTGSLENYHNVRLKYLPKRIHFTRETTAIRSMLTVIEVNSNIRTEQSTKMYGRWSKHNAEWVLKRGFDTKDYSYRTEIMNEIKKNIVTGNVVRVDMTEYIPKNLPTIAQKPKPSKEVLLQRHKSRMELSQASAAQNQ